MNRFFKDGRKASPAFVFLLTLGICKVNAQVSFAPQVPYNVGESQYIAMDDFNGDGIQDLVMTIMYQDKISVLLGVGDGTFSAPATYATGLTPTSVSIADFNADGDKDLAVINNSDADVTILLGNGDGTFHGNGNYGVNDTPIYSAAGDLNGDNKADLVVANYNGNNLSVLFGNGDGTFQPEVRIPTSARPDHVLIRDLNGDAKPDILVTYVDESSIAIFLGNGDGTFLAESDFNAGDGPSSAVIGDFDLDGKLDVAVANEEDNISVLKGNGDGSFQSPVSTDIGMYPTCIAAGDFDNDGDVDFAVTDWGLYDLRIVLNDGSGNFSSNDGFSTGDQPRCVVVGDFNKDGLPDAAVVNEGSTDLNILINNRPVTTPVTLVNFKVSKVLQTLKVQWGTVSEINNQDFIVQKSIDKLEWVDLGIVQSKAVNGNSSIPISYSFTDAAPTNGMNYYRLLQRNKNGKAVYSPVINDEFETNIDIYPNPATGILHIKSIGNSDYYLTSVTGQVVLKGTLKPGGNEVNVSNLSSGIYSLKIGIQHFKIVIKK